MAPIMGGRQDRWHCEHGPPLNVYIVNCTEANAFKGGVGAFTRGGCYHNITSHPKFLLQALSNGQWKTGAKILNLQNFTKAPEPNNWRCLSLELNVTFLL